MEKLIVVAHEDDKETIEVIKKAVGEKAVEILMVPKSIDEESIKSRIQGNRKLCTLAVLGASIGSSSDYEKMIANVLNDPNLEVKLAKDIEEFNKILECREPDMIELESTKGLFDTTPWYNRFVGKGRTGNHWGDKSKFRKKGRIKHGFIYNCNNPDL